MLTSLSARNRNCVRPESFYPVREFNYNRARKKMQANFLFIIVGRIKLPPPAHIKARRIFIFYPTFSASKKIFRTRAH